MKMKKIFGKLLFGLAVILLTITGAHAGEVLKVGLAPPLTGDMAAYSEAELAMIDRDGSAVKITGTWAGDNLFSVLGVVPFLGRTFNPDDEAQGAQPVVILSDELWRSNFGAREDILGETVLMDSESVEIVRMWSMGVQATPTAIAAATA